MMLSLLHHSLLGLLLLIRLVLSGVVGVTTPARHNDRVDFAHELTTMLDLFKSIDALFVHLAKIVKLTLQAPKPSGFLHYLWGNVVPIIIQHDLFEKFAFFRLILHEHDAKLNKLVLGHSFDSFLDNS